MEISVVDSYVEETSVIDSYIAGYLSGRCGPQMSTFIKNETSVVDVDSEGDLSGQLIYKGRLRNSTLI